HRVAAGVPPLAAALAGPARRVRLGLFVVSGGAEPAPGCGGEPDSHGVAVDAAGGHHCVGGAARFGLRRAGHLEQGGLHKVAGVRVVLLPPADRVPADAEPERRAAGVLGRRGRGRPALRRGLCMAPPPMAGRGHRQAALLPGVGKLDQLIL
ncbi:hypothetical protein H4S02_008520, partial [Coemansia sp. RSA 2611]